MTFVLLPISAYFSAGFKAEGTGDGYFVVALVSMTYFLLFMYVR